MRRFVLTLAVVSAACTGGSTPAPSTGAPESTPQSTPEPASAATPAPAAPSGKEQLTAAMIGAQDLGPWAVSMGYDLGILRMLVLARPADAQPVTLADFDPAAPGADASTMKALFAGGAVDGSHPFELLGYDHVVPRGADAVTVSGRSIPRLAFSWLRVDPDTAARESGRGTALQLHCGDGGLIGGRWVVLASETPGTDHDPAPVAELAGRLTLCAK